MRDEGGVPSGGSSSPLCPYFTQVHTFNTGLELLMCQSGGYRSEVVEVE